MAREGDRELTRNRPFGRRNRRLRELSPENKGVVADDEGLNGPFPENGSLAACSLPRKALPSPLSLPGIATLEEAFVTKGFI
ncbi:hypothetical protein Dimus_007463 [Dionaea muscipula]